MSVHIAAKKGEIAESILLPGDPKRAKWIAENFLKDVICYNDIRGMLGFTGTYKGKRVSIQGTGMGIPSISIYISELMAEYGVKNLFRVGTAGSYQEDIKLRDVILAMSASTNSSIISRKFNGANFAPTANFELFREAIKVAEEKNINIKAGNIFTSDEFYNDEADSYKKWSEYGVLAVEMETAALYTLAAKYKARALSLLTISDSIFTDKITSAEEREKTFSEMIEIALETAIRF